MRTLDELWARGELRELEEDLDSFVRRHAKEIQDALLGARKFKGLTVARQRKERGEISDNQLLDFCVRSLIRSCGSVNPKKDIDEQKKEIENEIWFEGERSRCEVNEDKREEIARAWAQLHASKWREWRLYKLLYIWQKKCEVYFKQLTGREQASK